VKWGEYCAAAIADFKRGYKKRVITNTEPEKTTEPIKPRGMYAHVRSAFEKLEIEALTAMARDWTSLEDAQEYAKLHEELCTLEEKYNAQIGRR
jgi:hypothetical protein